MIRSFFVVVLGSRDGSSLPWLSILGTSLIFCDDMQLDVVFDGHWFLVRNEFLKECGGRKLFLCECGW